MMDDLLTKGGWARVRIDERRDWTPDLVTFRFDRAIDTFEAGQFFNLGLLEGNELLRRSYSAASPPGAKLEFFITRVAGGSFTSALFRLGVGDSLLLETKPQGFFTLRYAPEAQHLWCVATGTGLGPYLSMLHTSEIWQRFESIVLVHGARTQVEAVYADELSALRREHPELQVVRCISREPAGAPHLGGRITAALESGALERAAGLELSPQTSHVLLCGNPLMIKDMSELLAARGMRRHRQRKPGHFSTEKYW